MSVIDLDRERFKRGEPVFIGCPECQGTTDFAVTAISSTEGIVVTALVCVSDRCRGDTHLPVEYGRIE